MRPLYLLLALTTTTAPAWCQATPRDEDELRWQLEANGGVEASPLWAGAGLYVSTGRLLAVRFGIDSSVEFTLGADPTTVQAVGVSGGVRAQRGRMRFGAYAGSAVVWGRDRFDLQRVGPGREPYTTVGVGISGSAVYEVGGGLGLGLDLSGNVNPEVSRVGLRLAAHVRLNQPR
ncbi:hypothetical protein [Rubrivirga sp. IMCC43871]|uniref:hypothetical protein n=1 Tax=Rubrivirga sp. IMCC43871 TaxID=3391575 RepID=UPI00398FF043